MVVVVVEEEEVVVVVVLVVVIMQGIIVVLAVVLFSADGLWGSCKADCGGHLSNLPCTLWLLMVLQ